MSPTILHFSHYWILPPFVMHDNSPQVPLLCTNIASNRDETHNNNNKKLQTLKYLLQNSQASPTHNYDIGNLEPWET